MFRTMLRTVALALLALLALPAAASSYKGYYYGAKNPGEIATLVERSLAKDPTGRTMLDAAKCRRDGSCAAPINYLESFQSHDPHAGLTSVAQLPAYLRKLAIKCDPSGIYQMDRIVVRGNANLGATDLNGMTRRFLKKECAWVNPDTGRPVLAQNCANPVGQRVDLACVYVNFEVNDPSEFAVIWARHRKPDDECFAYRKVAKLYEAETDRTAWRTMPRGCIGTPCDFTAVNAFLGSTQVAQGQLPVERGIYQIRLAPDELLVLCLKARDAQGAVMSSFANGVRWRDDYRAVNGKQHARVYYETRQLDAERIALSAPRGLVFWASDAAAEARMRQAAGIR